MHVPVEILGKVVEVRGHHVAELVDEIFQRPFFFDGHVFGIGRGPGQDIGVEARGGKHGRCADFIGQGLVALGVGQVDDGIDAFPEFRAGGSGVTHDGLPK